MSEELLTQDDRSCIKSLYWLRFKDREKRGSIFETGQKGKLELISELRYMVQLSNLNTGNSGQLWECYLSAHECIA